ncbi:MAG: carbohydrate-binding protein, partial [Bacillota bacterium]|nr:carbohydrate-binding protein [Bacillota bacterium]
MIKKLASMLMAGAMCVSLGAALNVSAEGERYAKSSDYVSEKVTKGSDDVYYFSHGYDYIGFKNVDFTGMKSVEITGICNMLGSRDGDKVQIRIDSDKGQLLGYVDFGIHDPGKIKIFKGSIDSVTGVHDLYFVSSFSTSSSVGIKSFVLSKDEYINKYEPIPDSAVIDNHSSTWTFTDDLGRRAADYEEVGPIRGDKYVGIFYWTWHNNFETLAPLNMSEFAKLHPEAKYDFTNVAWPGGVAHFWNEPMFGYYAGIDYWVYRKHAQMLADAGVDVLLFDTTNGTNTWRREYQVLFKALIDARKNGLDTPKVAFISNFAPTNTSSKENITRTYMNAYMDGKYSDLWFYWKGKPLIMANTDQLKARDGDAADSQLMDEIKNFFTFRSPQPSYVTGDTTGTQWGWLEVYPKHGFYKKADGSYEQATVGVAANHSYETHTITAMNSPYLTGRSYTNELGTDLQEGAYKYGWFFKEQLKSAIDIDPEFMFITGWNEWIAGRNESWGGVLNASHDEYDNDVSRDMEPTKGDMKDDYYCLLVDSVRKFKGAEKLEAAGAAKTINMNDSKAWEGVTPEFINDKGTYNRDSVGYKGCNYKNDTARNNVIVSKVSRDSQYMY